MSDSLSTMSLHSFDEKLSRVASAPGSSARTAGVARDAEAAAAEATAFARKDEALRLDIRRGLEIRLIKRYDKAKIDPRTECWFLLDTLWLNEWASFVEGKEGCGPPGPLTTRGLLQVSNTVSPSAEAAVDLDASLSSAALVGAGGGASGEELRPLPGLEAKVDYRGVPPTVYFIFKELYGVEKMSPEICRYSVDIYSLPVPDEQYIKIVAGPQRQARIQVNKMRPRWEKPIVEEEERDGDDDCCCSCCGLTREHLEAFLFWAFTCCLRGRSGRSGVSYRNYSPLREPATSSEHGSLDGSSSSRHSSIDLDSSTRSSESSALDRSNRSGIGSGGSKHGLKSTELTPRLRI